MGGIACTFLAVSQSEPGRYSGLNANIVYTLLALSKNLRNTALVTFPFNRFKPNLKFAKASIFHLLYNC